MTMNNNGGLTSGPKKKDPAEAFGAAIGSFFAFVLVLTALLLLAAWPLMLWTGQLHDKVSSAVPDISYFGSVSLAGFLWTAGWIMSAGRPLSKKK